MDGGLKAVKRFPDNIETHQILASIYLSKRQITKAEQEFKKLIELDPYDIDSRFNLVTIYLSKGEDLKIAKEYEKIKELGYSTPEMRIKIANIYLENKTPNAVDLIKSGGVDLVINIPKDFNEKELTNDYIIRRTAVDFGVPLMTNLQLAQRLAEAMNRYTVDDLKIDSWNSYE